MAVGMFFPASINDKTLLCKTLIFSKPSSSTRSQTKLFVQFSSTDSSSPLDFSKNNCKTNSDVENPLQFGDLLRRDWSLKRSVFEKLKNPDSDPVRVLEDDGDWNKELFWTVIGFLNQTSRSNHVLEVFYTWKNKENTRVNEFNYERIIRLLVNEGLVEEALSALQELKSCSLEPSPEMYNSIIHGYARKGRFEDAMFYLKEMEDLGWKPYTETYNALIRAYARHRMYDDIAECVKRMESGGCFPDEGTYNLLIREFSQAGLLMRMERTYQTLRSKRMDMHKSTMVAMLEAYVNFGIIDKMEKVYKRAMNSNVSLKEGLIRKVALVYIENHMFSRLEDMGVDLSSQTGKTDLVWCLRILSHACVLSRKGMDSVVEEMESEGTPWHVTIPNIMLLAYAKMKDWKRFKVVLSELPAQYVKPDIVTFGILFDAVRCGFDGERELNAWKRMKFLDERVEMKTDPLVFTVFRKGRFLRNFEDKYSSLETDLRKSNVWTYGQLIKLVVEDDKRTQQEDNRA